MEYDELAEIDLTEDEIDAMMTEGEPVEVVGPFDPTRRVFVDVISTANHAYRWRFVAANGEILATSAATYRTAQDARGAASAITSALRETSTYDSGDTAGATQHRKAM